MEKEPESEKRLENVQNVFGTSQAAKKQKPGKILMDSGVLFRVFLTSSSTCVSAITKVFPFSAPLTKFI